MPGMDGFALLHALRADPATEAVPVIMLTSGDPHDPDHIVRDPQPDAFVKKSADLGPLLAEIRDALIPPPLISHLSHVVLFQHAPEALHAPLTDELPENKGHRRALESGLISPETVCRNVTHVNSLNKSV